MVWRPPLVKTGVGRGGNVSWDRTSGTGAEGDAEGDVVEDGPAGSEVVRDGVGPEIGGDGAGPEIGGDGDGDDRAKLEPDAGDGTEDG